MNEALASFGWIAFTIMTVVAILINHSWYKKLHKINKEWYDHCKTVMAYADKMEKHVEKAHALLNQYQKIAGDFESLAKEAVGLK